MARQKGSKNIKWNKEELERLYWVERMSCHQIAQKYGTVYQAVLKVMQRFGMPRRSHSEATGKDLHYRWQGGRYMTSTGYVLISEPNHHRANKAGYVLEHISIWERHYGRKLKRGEIIHHLNGDKADNNPLNLQAFTKSTHDKLIPALRDRIKQLEGELKKMSQMVMELL